MNAPAMSPTQTGQIGNHAMKGMTGKAQETILASAMRRI